MINVTVSENGLPEKLRAATVSVPVGAGRGVTAAAEAGKKIAQGKAPVASGRGRRGIVVRGGGSAGPIATAEIFNGVFYMRFQDKGTGSRYTSNGAYRGMLKPRGFMEDAEHALEAGIAESFVEASVGSALKAAGL